MREALGQPLENISEYLLNKVVTKEVRSNPKKYKSVVGKKPERAQVRASKERAGGS